MVSMLGEMLIDLPEECLFNILSFMLRPKEEMRLHYSKALRKIQTKYRIVISDVPNDYWGLGYRFRDPGVYKRYKVECRTGGVEKAIRIIQGQSNRIKNLLRSDGSTFMRIEAHYKKKICTKDVGGMVLRFDNTISLEELERQLKYNTNIQFKWNFGNRLFNILSFMFIDVN